jgi:hypothetical protein
MKPRCGGKYDKRYSPWTENKGKQQLVAGDQKTDGTEERLLDLGETPILMEGTRGNRKYHEPLCRQRANGAEDEVS